MQDEPRIVSSALSDVKPAPPTAPAPPFPACTPSEPFRSNRSELLAALFSYVVGYLYMKGVFQANSVFYLLFAAAFTAFALVFFRDRIRSAEHWVWLGCMWLCLLCEFCGRNQVWEDKFNLFAHAYAIYWILSLSGRLIDGKSSAFLPMDALNGAVLIPFSHFFTFFRTRVLGWGIRRLRGEKTFRPAGFVSALLAIAVAAVLFFSAGNLLSQADANFGAFLSDLLPVIDGEWMVDLFFILLLSIPVGAYLNGLVVGSGRVTDESLSAKKNGILSAISRLRHVSNAVWTVLLCAFAVLYLVFFGFQGSYFFGAFSRTLPETFTVAEYARQGFFELCRILALNFALLWLVYASSTKPVRDYLPGKLLCSVLLAESILFAVTALSKLLLYIDCFGFTPLRLQSFWLICVLMLGCILSLISLLTQKKTIRIWIYFTGISLALLHLY